MDVLLVIMHYYQVESWDNSAFIGSYPKHMTDFTELIMRKSAVPFLIETNIKYI